MTTYRSAATAPVSRELEVWVAQALVRQHEPDYGPAETMSPAAPRCKKCGPAGCPALEDAQRLLQLVCTPGAAR